SRHAPERRRVPAQRAAPADPGGASPDRGRDVGAGVRGGPARHPQPSSRLRRRGCPTRDVAIAPRRRGGPQDLPLRATPRDMSVALLRKVVEALERAGIAHMLTGSFASNEYGELRSTQDIDVVIDATPEQLDVFLDEFDLEDY